MRFVCLGGTREIGASCYMLETKESTIIVDAGIRVEEEGNAALPLFNNLPPSIEALFLTHAHLDHIGSLPAVFKQIDGNFPIYCSHGTHALLETMLKDALKVMKKQKKEGEIDALLYEEKDLEECLRWVRSFPFLRWFKAADRLSACFSPAGHILGASLLYLSTSEGNLCFTGDFSISPQRTLDRAEPLSDINVDVLVCESTYGDRFQTSEREKEEQRLVEKTREILSSGGDVLFPSFAIGRGQEILLILKSASQKILRTHPIYMAGLCLTTCSIYDLWRSELSESLPKDSGSMFFDAPLSVEVAYPGRDKEIIRGEPCCIIASSGMLKGGPSVGYAKQILGKHDSAILFSGYQAEETPGREILSSEEGDTIELDEARLPLRCQIEKYHLSAHASGEQIYNFVKKVKPREVYFVHGTPQGSENLAELLADKTKKAAVPYQGEAIDIKISKPFKSVDVPETDKYLQELDAKEIRTRMLSEGQKWYSLGQIATSCFGPGVTENETKRIKAIIEIAEPPCFLKRRLQKRPLYYPLNEKQVKKEQEGRKMMTKNAKGLLQEICHIMDYPNPEYKSKNVGTDNAPLWEVTISYLDNQTFKTPEPTGGRKTTAEIEAAESVLDIIKGKHPGIESEEKKTESKYTVPVSLISSALNIAKQRVSEDREEGISNAEFIERTTKFALALVKELYAEAKEEGIELK